MMIMKIFLLDKFYWKLNKINLVESFPDCPSLVSYERLCWRGYLVVTKSPKMKCFLKVKVFKIMWSAL